MKYILQKGILTELKKMFIWVATLSLLELILFFVFGFFDKTAVFGTLLGAAVSFLNFLFLAFTVEQTVKKGKGAAQSFMGGSYTVRLCFIAVAVVFAIKSPYINYVAAVIPLLFPRICILATNLSTKKKKEDKTV